MISNQSQFQKKKKKSTYHKGILAMVMLVTDIKTTKF